MQSRSVVGDDGAREDRGGSRPRKTARSPKAKTDRGRGRPNQSERCDSAGCPGEACRETGRGQGRFGACLEPSVRQQEEFGTILGSIPALTDVDALRGIDPASLDDGSPLSVTQLARLICDSSVSRLIFSASGEVLDVGRENASSPPLKPVRSLRGIEHADIQDAETRFLMDRFITPCLGKRAEKPTLRTPCCCAGAIMPSFTVKRSRSRTTAEALSSRRLTARR